MKVKEESEKTILKLNIQKTKSMASGCITTWQIDGKKKKNANHVIFHLLELQSHCGWWLLP